MIKLLERVRRAAVLGLGAFILMAAGQVGAQDKLFDHANTGFDLTGGHKFAACESCHVGGQFAGTPSTCVGCHSINGRITATPKPINHIYTSEQCDSCHSDVVWNVVPRVDHVEVFGSCIGCHNTNVAVGKPIDHIPASDECDSCHTNTVSWFPVRVDHDAIPNVNDCFSCHNNFRASGKPPGHIETTNNCVACHTRPGVSFIPVNQVDHDEIPNTVNNCMTCHEKDRPLRPDHPQSGECNICHTSTNVWRPSISM